MNPAGRARGRQNMMPAYIGQPAGHEKGPATALSPPRSAINKIVEPRASHNLSSARISRKRRPDELRG